MYGLKMPFRAASLVLYRCSPRRYQKLKEISTTWIREESRVKRGFEKNVELNRVLWVCGRFSTSYWGCPAQMSSSSRVLRSPIP